MTKWKSFLTRAISALIALAVLISLYVFLKGDGLKIAVGLAVAIGSFELVGILFGDEKSFLLKLLFYVLCVAVFLTTIQSLAAGALAYSLALIVFVIFVLLTQNRVGELAHMMEEQGKASLGLLYMGLLPAFSYKILEQSSGVAWFVYLLAVVFAGDTMAYVFGMLMGKHKVMPTVSPKKTWEGSIGGIVGSVVAGLVCWIFAFPETGPVPFVILAAVAGFVGQFGDFFESLLKRVADVKDSGKIMPGHGGVLDRIDGVLFASPVILAGILTLSHLLS
jgi:phosphatidate cytidylyltransferase